jgi:hypothetical protein
MELNFESPEKKTDPGIAIEYLSVTLTTSSHKKRL